jgi:hypothetical protein
MKNIFIFITLLSFSQMIIAETLVEIKEKCTNSTEGRFYFGGKKIFAQCIDADTEEVVKVFLSVEIDSQSDTACELVDSEEMLIADRENAQSGRANKQVRLSDPTRDFNVSTETPNDIEKTSPFFYAYNDDVFIAKSESSEGLIKIDFSTQNGEAIQTDNGSQIKLNLTNCMNKKQNYEIDFLKVNNVLKIRNGATFTR